MTKLLKYLRKKGGSSWVMSSTEAATEADVENACRLANKCNYLKRFSI